MGVCAAGHIGLQSILALPIRQIFESATTARRTQLESYWSDLVDLLNERDWEALRNARLIVEEAGEDVFADDLERALKDPKQVELVVSREA